MKFSKFTRFCTLLLSLEACKNNSTGPPNFDGASNSYQRFNSYQWVRGSSPQGYTLWALVATDSLILAGGVGAAYVSSDNGRTWLESDTINSSAVMLSLLPVDSHLITGTTYGTYYSTNFGSKWEKASADPSNAIFLSLASDSSTVVAASLSGDVYRSMDLGVTWQQLGPLPYTLNFVMRSGAALYSCGYTPGVFRSADNAQTWINIDPDANQSTTSMMLSGATIYTTRWGGGVRATTNVGQTWKNLNNGLRTLDVQAVIHANSLLFVATYIGVYLSTDNGDTWVPADTTLHNDPIWQLATNGHFLYAADSMGVVWSHAF